MFQQYRIEIKWAIYYSVFLLLWTAIEKISGLHGRYIELQQDLSIFLLIPAIVFYILALVNKKKYFFKGSMPYVQGFFSGIVLTVCIMALAPLVQFISYFIISPHYFSNLIQYSTDKGIYNAAQAARQFNYGNFLFINEVFLMLTGVVFSAFIPLFLNTNSGSKS